SLVPFPLAAIGLMLTGSIFAVPDAHSLELKSLAFSPSTIDTSRNGGDVRLDFTLDAQTPASYIEAVFVDPSGVFRQSASARLGSGPGTQSVLFKFPRLSTPGAWTLSQVFISDTDGNTLVLDADALSGRGFPTRLNVRSLQDTESPKLTKMDFS